MASLIVNYTIPSGTSVRIGYRITGSSTAFTYVEPNPTYLDSPYTISAIPVGSYEVELTTICSNCTTPSSPIVIQAESL